MFAVILALCTGATVQGGGASLTLDEVMRRVLHGNSELNASELHVRAQEVLRTYAGQFSNPRLQLRFEDALGTGPLKGLSAVEATLSVQQDIQLGGKRRAAKAVSEAEVDRAEAMRGDRQVHVLAKAMGRAIHVVADQRRLEVAERAKTLAQDAMDVATRRVQGGAAAALEQKRAGIVLARAHIGLEHAEHELRASKRRLSGLWGDPLGEFGAISEDLFRGRELPSFDELAARVTDNPDLILLARERDARLARLEHAKSEAIPNLRFNLGARRNQAVDAYSFVLGVSMPLPIFQRNRGEVGSAEAELEEIESLQESRRLETLVSLYAHIQELIHARETLEVLGRDILPNAEGVLELVERGVASGRYSQVELLDAQRTLVELSEERIDAAENVARLLVHIGALVGQRPQSAAKVGVDHEE